MDYKKNPSLAAWTLPNRDKIWENAAGEHPIHPPFQISPLLLRAVAWSYPRSILGFSMGKRTLASD